MSHRFYLVILILVGIYGGVVIESSFYDADIEQDFIEEVGHGY